MWKLALSHIDVMSKLFINCLKQTQNSNFSVYRALVNWSNSRNRIFEASLRRPLALLTVNFHKIANDEPPLDTAASLHRTLLRSIEQRRFRRKSFKLKKEQELRANKKAALEESAGSDDEDTDYDDDGDDDDEDDDVYEGADTPDANLPDGYRDMVVSLSSLRCDSLLSSGLGLTRVKVEEAFYSHKIMVNGKKVAKKSHSVQEGDVVDLVSNQTDDTLTVQRVILLKVFDTLTANQWYKVGVRRWKTAIEVDIPK